jgi:hypothetical protein
MAKRNKRTYIASKKVLKDSGVTKKYEKAGQPTKYDPSYCAALIKWQAQGGSLTSFAAEINVSRDVLYEWRDHHQEFFYSIKKGEWALNKWFETLFKTMAAGQLKRVTKEIVKRDENGNEEVVTREYAPTQGSAAAAIFMAKNMIGWRDRQDIAITGKDDGPIKYQDMTVDQIKGLIEESLLILDPNAKRRED